ncbi:MAG: protein kinase [Candidatus Melainabacteria bacterium]|nr:protein kinase [Candidatus Melainabacteria bacterium]
MDTSGSHTPRFGLPKVELPKTLLTESGVNGSNSELLNVGQVISERYKVLSVLGHGGMGAVYRVEQIFLRQMFALKTLHGQAFTDVALRRFHKEAQAASRLSHPNLVKAHDFGVLENHQPFFVMDLVEGQNLSEYSRKVGILSVEEVLNIFIPVCFGLGYAHEQGVIHRDIKPGNIMLAKSLNDPTGYTPKVVDFGIAKMTEGEDGHSLTLTRTGEVFGTPLYMSPEQCMGVKVDHRSDVYSLGCVMYEALTGAPPFHGDTALNLMMKHQTAMPATMKEASLGREFPDQLEAIIAKSLIKDPDTRYQNFFDLARDLATLKQELAEVSPKKTPSRAHSRTVKDIPIFVAPQVREKKSKAGFLVAALCVGSFVGGACLGLNLPARQKPAVQESTQSAQVSDSAIKNYDEALSVGHARYMRVDGGGAQPMQVYKFPDAFDIGVFKYTHPMVKIDNSRVAQGSISVPFEADTYLRVPASRLYSYPHLLRGFRAGDLQHLHIVEDAAVKVEDLGFVYDASLSCCTDLTGLKEVFLFGTKTTDKGLNFIKDLPSLESLDVSDSNVTNSGVRSLKNFPEMTYLGLKNVAGAKHLIDRMVLSKRLKVLNLAEDDLDDSDVKRLARIEQLQFLTVDSNPKVTNEGLKPFKNLIALSIAATGVTPQVARTLKQMPNLRVLTISKDKWTARDVQRLVADLPNLTLETKKLDSNNRLTNWNWREEL